MTTQKETIELYKGDVAITFYPNSHRYKLEGSKTYIPSVTSITGQIDKSRVLMMWAANLCKDFLSQNEGEVITEEIINEAPNQYQKKKEEACTIGTMVHDYAEEYVRRLQLGIEPPAMVSDPHAQQGIYAFQEWIETNEIKFLSVEEMIYSKKYDYVGRFDALIEWNGKKYIVDYKTSKKIYPEHKIQSCGYKLAYTEEHGVDIDGIIILKFDKETGEFDAYVEEETKQLEDTFLLLAQLKHNLKNIK